MEEGHIFPTFVYLYRVGSCPGETGTREGHYDPARLSASHIRYRRRARLLSQWLVPDKQHQPRWFSRWLEKSEAGPLLKPNTWKLLLLLLAFPPPRCFFLFYSPSSSRSRYARVKVSGREMARRDHTPFSSKREMPFARRGSFLRDIQLGVALQARSSAGRCTVRVRVSSPFLPGCSRATTF